MAGVIVSSKLLISQVESLAGAAACVERARWELVSCGAPPGAWAMALMLGLLVGLAAMAGSEWRLAAGRRR